MLNNKTKKIVVGFLLLGQIFLFPSFVFAQIAVTVSDSNTGNNIGGPAGIANNARVMAELVAARAENDACAAAEAAFEAGDAATQFAFSFGSVIGGSAILSKRLEAKITKYQGFLSCRNAVLVTLRNIDTPSVFTSGTKEQMESQVKAVINTIGNKAVSLQAQLDNAQQGFWKTLTFNILIKTSKAVADTLVSKLVNSYKIKDYKQYADSMATLVYDNQFIRQNYPDNQSQMMARAILTNPLVRSQVPTAMFTAADAALGFDPKALNPNDPNYYSKMASVGAGQANPYLQQNIYVANADIAHANAMSYSQNQISQSNGLKTPVNCAGSLAQQKAIDGQTTTLWNQLDNRDKLLRDLNNAKQANMPVSASDLSKAQADYNAALASWNKAPDALGANNAAMVMCEAIVSPPILINKAIDQAFTAVGVNMAQYNNNNLPSYINIIGDVASQIGTSFVLGGSQGAKSAALINEGKLVSSTAGAAIAYSASNASQNLANGIVFNSPEQNSSITNGYTISWQVITDQMPTASYVTISGDGISSTGSNPQTKQTTINKLPLEGSYAITTTVGGNYILTVYDAAGKALTAASTTLTVQNQKQAFNSTNSDTAVLGAFTSKPSLDIRGPAVVISPRGN